MFKLQSRKWAGNARHNEEKLKSINTAYRQAGTPFGKLRVGMRPPGSFAAIPLKGE